jgi:hypothetical protein
MTVSNFDRKNQYNGNGSTTAFTYSFEVWAATDLKVYVDTALQTISTQYSVSGVQNNTGGQVTFVTPPGAGTVVTIFSEMPSERTVDYQTAGPAKAKSFNADFDRIWMKIKEIENAQERNMSVSPLASPLLKLEVPTPVPDAFVRASSDGLSLTWGTVTGSGTVSTATTVTAGIAKIATNTDAANGLLGTGPSDEFLVPSNLVSLVPSTATALALTSASSLATIATLGKYVSVVTLTDAATITPDQSAGQNFKVTIGAAGRTLANMTNAVAGTSGWIEVIQDATGGRTITTLGNSYVWTSGSSQIATIDTTANAVSVINYRVLSSGKIQLSVNAKVS